MSQHQATRGPAPAAPIALCLALGAGLLLGAGAVSLWHPTHGTVPPPAAALPGLVHRGDLIVVPAGSPYRGQIVLFPVMQRRSEQTLLLPAAVESDPAQVTNVLPPLGGRVTQLKVELGDHVRQGQVLAVIESGDLAQAVSDVDKARAQAALAHDALVRARGLGQIGGGAQKDTESAANDAAQADTEFARARDRLATLRGAAARSAPAGALAGGALGSSAVGMRDLAVLAPTSGVVTALSTSRGSYINDPTQPLMTISNFDHVWVTADVPEEDVRFVSKGQPLEIRFPAYPGEVFHSTILFVDDVLDPAVRRVRIHASLPDPDGRLKSNMFGTVTLHAPPNPALFVPNSALVMNNDSTSVYVETAPWTFAQRDVRTGAQQSDQTEIVGGLSAGDTVVSQGGVLLND